MLPNLQQFLSLLVCGIQLWGAALTYWLPLRHSPHFWQRALLCLIPSIPLSTFLLWADHTPFSLFLRAGAYILFCMWMIFASHSCTQLDWSGANYCAIWGILSALTTFELWQLLVWCLAQVNIFLPLDQPSALLLQLLFFAAAYCLLRVTVAHSMPYEGSYHIGPPPANQRYYSGRHVRSAVFNNADRHQLRSITGNFYLHCCPPGTLPALLHHPFIFAD